MMISLRRSKILEQFIDISQSHDTWNLKPREVARAKCGEMKRFHWPEARLTRPHFDQPLHYRLELLLKGLGF